MKKGLLIAFLKHWVGALEKEDKVKWLGILIIALMAFSMLAYAYISILSDKSGSSASASQDTLPSDSLNASTFTYTLSFDTVALKELNSFRMIVETTEIDKQKIDLAVEKVEGVSKVASQFKKADGDAWYYYAEVALKKGYDTKAVSAAVLGLDFFSSNPSSGEAMKYMTISSSQKVVLHNTDLNITRDYNFGTSTLSSMVNMDTQPNDAITVEGSIKLQGSTVTALELAEKANLTSAPKTYNIFASLPIASLEEGIMFQGEAPMDANIDQNALKADLAAIDQNAQIFFFSFGSQNSFFGSAVKTDRVSDINAVLTKYGLSAPIIQPATFDLNSVNIPELGKELPFTKGPLKAEVAPGHKAGDLVSLALEVTVIRGTIDGINAKEN